MHKISSKLAINLVCGIGVLAGCSGAFAQSRTLPAGSALAQTPPADQKRKQFEALPQDQKNSYVKQEQQRMPPKG